MKKPKLEIQLADVNTADFAAPLFGQFVATLRLARARKTHTRRRSGRLAKQWGYPVPLESWRHLLARYLRRVLPTWCALFVGGHHIAIHVRRPSVGAGEFSEICLARFVEVTPV